MTTFDHRGQPGNHHDICITHGITCIQQIIQRKIRKFNDAHKYKTKTTVNEYNK